jgi:hypothetical protein
LATMEPPFSFSVSGEPGGPGGPLCESCATGMGIPPEGICCDCKRVSQAPHHGHVAFTNGAVTVTCAACTTWWRDCVRMQSQPVTMAPPSAEELEALAGGNGD